MKIAIVGAGIMGQLTALALCKAGHQLTVFERNSQDCLHNSSMAAAGMLSCLAELEKSELDIYQLGMDSLKNYWPSILSSLPETIYFSGLGTLLVAHPNDKAELARFVRVVMAKRINNAQIKNLSESELNAKEPQLTQFKEAYYFADEAQLDNQTLMLNLANELKRLGVEWRYGTNVTRLAAYEVAYESTVDHFDYVIDCRGIAAKDQFADLRGVRGELIWLKAPEVKIKHLIRLLHPRYSLYLVPRPNDIYIVGASEIESEDNSTISVRTSLELLSAAFYLHPAFAEARIIKTMTQCRPTLANHQPKIKFEEGLVAVNGLYRHGFLIAPALAHEVLSFIESGISEVKYPHFWEEICVKH